MYVQKARLTAHVRRAKETGNHQTFEKEQRYEHLSVPPSYAPELVSKLFSVVTRSAAKQTEMPE